MTLFLTDSELNYNVEFTFHLTKRLCITIKNVLLEELQQMKYFSHTFFH